MIVLRKIVFKNDPFLNMYFFKNGRFTFEIKNYRLRFLKSNVFKNLIFLKKKLIK